MRDILAEPSAHKAVRARRERAAIARNGARRLRRARDFDARASRTSPQLWANMNRGALAVAAAGLALSLGALGVWKREP